MFAKPTTLSQVLRVIIILAVFALAGVFACEMMFADEISSSDTVATWNREWFCDELDFSSDHFPLVVETVFR